MFSQRTIANSIGRGIDMNECKATADIVELVSRIVIIVEVDEGQKKKRPAATDRKEKREVSNGNTKRSMTASRFFA